ncbi:MAG: hypothetical protein NTW19_12865 [Planctomycetota bacterium]|nr:hypothetical protein [Planctomycetota bacterium]
MPSPTCIVESGKLSPVGDRNLALFHAQSARPLLVVLMSEAHIKAGYFSTEAASDSPAAWVVPFRQAGIQVTGHAKGLRSGTRALIVLTAAEWAIRKSLGFYKDGVFQVWGDGGEANAWPVMAS